MPYLHRYAKRFVSINRVPLVGAEGEVVRILVVFGSEFFRVQFELVIGPLGKMRISDDLSVDPRDIEF